jgi:hypothetical protein
VKALRAVSALVLVIVGAFLVIWGIPVGYVRLAGAIVPGEVISKQESFAMPGDDRWSHIFEVTYRYQPSDASYPMTASHAVDEPFYRRLHTGSVVQVRYSPWSPLRHMKGVGSALEGSSVFSRMPHESDNMRVIVELSAVALAGILAFLAYRLKTTPLILAASLVGAVVCSGVLLFGFIVFPILFGVWRKSPEKGFGFVLITAIALSAALLYWRIPRPATIPPGPQRTAMATVRHVETVHHIWSNGEDAGQDLRQPFQMADLAFTPEGANEPIHVLDRVDAGSVPQLKDGAALQVVYPVSDPRAGRIDGGTRTYPEKALTYILGLTYGLSALIVLVVWPIIVLLDRLQVQYLGFRAKLPSSPDDPRWKRVEEYLRNRKR